MGTVEKVKDSMSDFFSEFIDSTYVTEGIDGTAIISTPFLDRHNDVIEIQVSESEGGFVLSDGGYFISDIHMCGCNPNRGKRFQLLSTILTSSGSALENGIITKRVNKTEFGAELFAFIQALLSIGDLYYTSESSVATMFFDDVMESISTGNDDCETDAELFARVAASTGGNGEISEENKKIIHLYATGQIDYETAKFAINKSFEH